MTLEKAKRVIHGILQEQEDLSLRADEILALSMVEDLLEVAESDPGIQVKLRAKGWSLDASD